MKKVVMPYKELLSPWHLHKQLKIFPKFFYLTASLSVFLHLHLEEWCFLQFLTKFLSLFIKPLPGECIYFHDYPTEEEWTTPNLKFGKNWWWQAYVWKALLVTSGKSKTGSQEAKNKKRNRKLDWKTEKGTTGLGFYSDCGMGLQ